MTEVELNAAIKKASDLRDRINQMYELLKVFDRKIETHMHAFVTLKNALDAARAGYCMAIAAPIEARIRADQKLQRQVLDAFVCLHAVNGDGMNSGVVPRFEGLLEDIIPRPDDATLAAAVAEFHREHIAPIVGDTE